MQVYNRKRVHPDNIIEQRATEAENHVCEILNIVNEVSDIN